MFPDQGRNKNLTAAFPARDNPVREIYAWQKVRNRVLGGASSGRCSMPPSPVLFRCRIWRSRGAATAAATAAAEAAVQAVMRTLSRKSPARRPQKGAKPLVGQLARKDASTGTRTANVASTSTIGPNLTGNNKLADAHNRASAFRILDYLL